MPFSYLPQRYKQLKTQHSTCIKFFTTMTENTNHERDTPHRLQTLLAKIPVLCLHLLVLLPHQIFVSVVAPGAPWILLKMLLICKEIKLPAPPLSCRNSTQISTRIQMVVTPSYSVNSLYFSLFKLTIRCCVHQSFRELIFILNLLSKIRRPKRAIFRRHLLTLNTALQVFGLRHRTSASLHS